MAIAALVPVNTNPITDADLIGHALWQACMAHFVQNLGQVGLGLSYRSCSAALAVAQHGQYEARNLVLPTAGAVTFSVLYGCSRLFQGLDPDFNQIHAPSPALPFSSSLNQEHAEQTAIRLAAGLNAWTLGGHRHLYIDLSPCVNCHNWLQQRPESWYVHYRTALGNNKAVSDEKKDMRKQEFDRVMEPPMKRARVT